MARAYGYAAKKRDLYTSQVKLPVIAFKTYFLFCLKPMYVIFLHIRFLQRPDSDTSAVEESCDAKQSSTNEISGRRVTPSFPNIKISRKDVSQDTVCSWVAEGYGMSSLHYYEAISREIFRQTKLALETPKDHILTSWVP